MPEGIYEETTVLFCGEEFARGFSYSQEACRDLPSVKVIQCPRQEITHYIGSAVVLVPLMTPLTADLLKKATRAKLILQFGVGLEAVDILAAADLGIVVSNIPSDACGNALSCSEMVFHLILTCLRKSREMDMSIKNRVLGQPVGETLFGKTCLVIGFGNIAKELTPRLKAFGARIIGVRQSSWGGLPECSAEKLLDQRASWPQLRDVAAQADLLILTCTQTPATKGMINENLLQSCKDGVIIINVARGGLLDYNSVLSGLHSGKIGAVGLDVQWQEPIDPADEIAAHPRVYLTPHVAGVTELSYRSESTSSQGLLQTCLAQSSGTSQ